MTADSSVINHLGVAGLLVYTLEAMKRTPWFPWVNKHSDKINRLISVLSALTAAVGIEVAASGNIHTGGQIIFTYPSLAQMFETGMHFIAQFAMQEALYKSAIKPVPPTVQMVDKVQVVNVEGLKS